MTRERGQGTVEGPRGDGAGPAAEGGAHGSLELTSEGHALSGRGGDSPRSPARLTGPRQRPRSRCGFGASGSVRSGCSSIYGVELSQKSIAGVADGRVLSTPRVPQMGVEVTMDGLAEQGSGRGGDAQTRRRQRTGQGCSGKEVGNLCKW